MVDTLTQQGRTEVPPASGADAGTQRAWHAVPAETALADLGTTPDGLAPEEAARRLKTYGSNRLPIVRQASLLRRFLRQFDNILIHVLLLAALVTALLGHYVDTAVILLVVVINAIIGYAQEGKAEAALEAIRSMLQPTATAIRGGHRRTVEAVDLVPGDIVQIEAGDRVPADLRLIRTKGLRLQEAALTGESVPVEKTPAEVEPELPLGDRSGMAYSGTLVTTGHGLGVVVATGTATELGRISTLLQAVGTLRTPLLRRMDRFGRQLTAVILILSALVLMVGVMVHKAPLADSFLAIVGMAVAAIPEGLPAVLTITLAIGVQRMAGRNAIIRRLPAVETLGAVSVICSDKTGTLTRNEMTVGSVVLPGAAYAVSGAGYDPAGGFQPLPADAPVGEQQPAGAADIDPAADPGLLDIARAAALCNDSEVTRGEGGWTVNGDPMEGALTVLAGKAGLDALDLRRQYPRRDEIPFDAAHRFMATLHHAHDGTAFVCVKGAPERVLAMCSSAGRLEEGTVVPCDRARWEREVERLAAAGQRVLALAAKRMPGETSGLTFADVEDGLVLLGLVGLIDPPRPEAVAAVAECRSAGIRVKMITGDHAATAQAIARSLGLERTDRVVTGQELETVDDEGLKRLAMEVDVFARTSPEHKLRLVNALQADGAVIAMTGDGVNDAPALKRADVGIAMGHKGTEAAKEASEMVLADDNFASIVAAVREGRTVYDNLTKVIAWTLPTNGGQALCIIAAILVGATLPMTAVQILWVNMVSAVALGLTLAFEPSEWNIMQRPPRQTDAPILSRFLVWRVVLVSVLFLIAAFGIFEWAMSNGRSLEEARTLVVNTIVVLEIAYLFSVRYLHLTSFSWVGMLGTPAVLIGITVVTALQFAFTYLPPFQALFGTAAVRFGDGVIVVVLGAVLLVFLELEKMIRQKFLHIEDD
ncbi:cation-transporting P-type ATPase [Rhodospirillum centenum]|uniref:Cation-transporting ATPase Pma1, putative n=1 Tax=Rhodospirillum centenum (strain ATCC 51521 / SW) TaxID=414684 RepID=B6IUJ9_RHOCS|nr:cation-transporting P-type ATPase [Rhodospirillum centenum]ACI99824.1 cation-transporting ATPase Pma1, putative [Rhodospirillum centenum SW]